MLLRNFHLKTEFAFCSFNWSYFHINLYLSLAQTRFPRITFFKRFDFERRHTRKDYSALPIN